MIILIPIYISLQRQILYLTKRINITQKIVSSESIYLPWLGDALYCENSSLISRTCRRASSRRDQPDRYPYLSATGQRFQS